MTTLVKSVQKSTFSANDALESLQAIYAIETIDLKSVRSLSKNVVEQSPVIEQVAVDEPLQAVADLGAPHREFLPSYVLLEPIQVLSLPRTLEKILFERSIFTLQELQNNSLSGLGSGHVEDIRSALKGYLKGKSLQKCLEIDFLSTLKCSAWHLERVSLFLLLEPYGLMDLITLLPSEKVEVKKLSFTAKKEIREKALKEIKKEFIRSAMKEVIETWIKPWILRRGGIALDDEVVEYIELLSKEGSFPIFKFFKEIGVSHESLLHSPEPSIFVASQYDYKQYQDVYKTAKTYFISRESVYSLEEITSYLQREFALKWVEVPVTFIRKLFFYTPQFRCYRSDLGQFIVSCNFN